MHLHFTSKENVYAILTQLKKIASYKEFSVSFDDDHNLFDHPRWGKQIEELVQSAHLQIIFIAKTKKQKEYFESCYLPYQQQYNNAIVRGWKRMRDIVLLKNTYQYRSQQSTAYGLLLLIEIVLLCALLRFLWKFISPNTVVTLIPHNGVDMLATNIIVATNDYQGERSQVLALKSGVVDFTYSMSLTTNNISYTIQPAQGEVVFYNYLPREVILLKSTKIIAEDGSIFKTQKEIKLFASDGTHPTQAKGRVMAMEYREDGSSIGEDGNKKKDTIFLIKNLPETHKEKLLYAQPTKDFLGGATQAKGSVLEKDIKDLEEKAFQQVSQERVKFLQNFLKKQGTHQDEIVLFFPDLISLSKKSFRSNVLVGQTSPFLEGTIVGTIHYYYMEKPGLEKILMDYLKERNAAYTIIKAINYDSLIFESKRELSGGNYMIATKAMVTQQYDFARDPYHIIHEIRQKIAGMDPDEAKKLLLSYDFIAKANITVTPWRYRSISSNPERIKFYIDNE